MRVQGPVFIPGLHQYLVGVQTDVYKRQILARVLDSMHLEYRITSETAADLFAKPSVTQLAVSLAEEGCEVLSMTEKDESLESYYQMCIRDSHAASIYAEKVLADIPAGIEAVL